MIYIALIEEQRSRKVLILNNKTENNVKTFYLFTIGKKIKIDRQNNRINDYVEEVLMPYFGNLICFVKECEIFIEKDNLNALKSYECKKLLIYFLIQT